MKTFIVVAFAAALSTTPALAQDRPDPPRGPAARPMDMDMDKMTTEQMHKHCAAIMGGEMQGRRRHDHAADKLGHAPRTTPPDDAEMKKMHERCAAMMAERGRKKTPPKR